MATARSCSTVRTRPAPGVPSVVSLFVGQRPFDHGVVDFYLRLPEKQVTLAETLAAHGFDTTGFLATPVMIAPQRAVSTAALGHSSSSGSGPFGFESIGQNCLSCLRRAAICWMRMACCGSLATLVSS